MPSLRIVAAGAFLLVFSVMAAAGASAQSAAPGKPIELLPTPSHAERTKTKAHARRIGRRLGKTHFAAAKRRPKQPQQIAKAESAKATTAKAETARAALPANIWPGLGDAAPTAAAAPVQAAAAAAAPVPSELVVGGRTVQVVSPDDANDIDLAADPPQAAVPTQGDVTATAPAARTVVVARAHAETNAVGSASWIAQVLAALGGAVAAGSLAWFLIGSAPQRTYG